MSMILAVAASLASGVAAETGLPLWLMGIWCPVREAVEAPPARQDPLVPVITIDLNIDTGWYSMGPSCLYWAVANDQRMIGAYKFGFSGIPDRVTRMTIERRRGQLRYRARTDQYHFQDLGWSSWCDRISSGPNRIDFDCPDVKMHFEREGDVLTVGRDGASEAARYRRVGDSSLLSPPFRRGR